MTKEYVLGKAIETKRRRKCNWEDYDYFKRLLPSMPPEEYEEAIKTLSEILEV